MTTLEGRVSRLEGLYESLATKEDLANLKGELKEDISNLSSELKEDISSLSSEFKADIANLRAEVKEDIGNLKGDFTWRVASLQLLGLGVVVAIIRFLG